MLHNLKLIVITLCLTLLAVTYSSVPIKLYGNSIKQQGVPYARRWDSALSTSSEDSDYVRRLKKASDCWMGMNAGKHIDALKNLTSEYAGAIDVFRHDVTKQGLKFDEQVLQTMLLTRGRMQSENGYDIPAGLNLGGYCMMRMPNSILFFHRMKLRNQTRFRINSLKTDLIHPNIKLNMSLNDLHLQGSYERARNFDGSLSDLFYEPTYGEVQILLKDVDYQVEGKIRYIGDSPYIVMMRSEISFPEALMIYKNDLQQSQSHSLTNADIGDFLDRLKSDLEEWLRDFLNEQLVFFRVPKANSGKIREYFKRRNVLMNDYVEDSLKLLKKKLRAINASSVIMPSMSLSSSVHIQLSEGVLRGLDTMYRRSFAVGGYGKGAIHEVDSLVGFSNLKAQYKYTAVFKSDVPPLTGLLILSADELAAHMTMSLVKNPDSVDLSFDSIHQLKPESLTVEGPANRLIGTFRHLLEHHVISIMSNALYHNIRQLSTLVKCRPNLYGSPNSIETGYQKEQDQFLDGKTDSGRKDVLKQLEVNKEPDSETPNKYRDIGDDTADAKVV